VSGSISLLVTLDGVGWIIDPGHGWLRVPLVSAEGLSVSEYSYVDKRGGWLYLEEDCDAGLWLRAHKVSGDEFPMNILNVDAPVRNLPRVPAVGSWVCHVIGSEVS